MDKNLLLFFSLDPIRSSMKASVKYFFGGLFFFMLGSFARSLYAGVQPGPQFQVHPLAAGHSGVAVELLGWIGVLGYFLMAVGIFLMAFNLWKGLESGAIQAYAKQKMPKRKVLPVEGDEDEEKAGE